MGARKSRSSQRMQEQSEAVAGSGEHGATAIAIASFEVIAAHPVLGLDVLNDRLDRGATTHLAADRGVTRRTWSLSAMPAPAGRAFEQRSEEV
jgi:hypothetical protein